MDNTNATARRAIKSAALAASAELVGSTAEMTAAATLAGKLAAQAGLAIDAIDAAVPSLLYPGMGDARHYLVAAYYGH